MKSIIPCELCEQEATFYCAADTAFLCNACDASVHGANFLVARHIRQALCVYQDADDPTDSLSSSSSSACMSTAESAITKRSGRNEIGRKKGVEVTVTGSSSGVTEVSSVEGGSKTRRNKRAMEEVEKRRVLRFESTNMGNVESHMNQQGLPRRAKYSMMAGSDGGVDRKVEGVFRSWCRKIFGDERESQHELVAAAALRAIRLCMGVLPTRVSLAASFWVALRLSKRIPVPMSMSTSMSMLERVEEVSGVPARLIVVAERRVARLLRTATAGSSKQKGCHHQLQEGWAES